MPKIAPVFLLLLSALLAQPAPAPQLQSKTSGFENGRPPEDSSRTPLAPTPDLGDHRMSFIQADVTPPSLDISAGSGHVIIQGTPPVANSVALWNKGPAVSFKFTVDQPWMSVSPSSGTLSENGFIAATMMIDVAGLAPGFSLGTLTASAPGRASVTALYYLNVTPATLSSPTSQLTLSGPASNPAHAGPAMISTNTRGVLSYWATTSAAWLTAATPSQTLTAVSPGSVMVSYVGGSLPGGTHRGSVTIHAPPAAPLTIPVEATLTGTPLSADPVSVSLRAASQAVLTTTLRVNFPTPGLLNVRTSSPGGWLSADQSVFSSSPATLTLRLNPSLASAGVNSGTVTLSSSSNGLTLQVPVTLEVVQAVSALSAWPPRLEFLQGSSTWGAQSVKIRSLLPSPVSFTLESTANWLSVPSGSFSAPANLLLEIKPGQIPLQPASTAVRLVPHDPTQLIINIPVSLTPASTGSYVIPQIADGGGFRTCITLVNGSATPASVRMDLFRRASSKTRETEPWWPAFQDGANWGQFTIPAFGGVFFETLGLPETADSGWARIQSSAALQGFAVYRQRQPSGIDQEASVPLLSERQPRFLLPFDQTAGQSSAIAIANVCDPAASILASVNDDTGTPIASSDLGTWPSMGHDAFVLSSALPATAGRRGTVEFSASQGCVAPVGLRFTPQGAFTSVDPQPPSAAQSLVFPQLAAGGGFSTSLVLTNHDTQPAPISLQFRSSGGEGSPSAAWDLGLPSSILVLPGSSITLDSSSQPATPVSGWARAVSMRRISGFAVFRRKLSDVELQEATVAGKSAASSRSVVPFDNTGGLVTSMAAVNESTAQPLSITVVVRDPDGQAIAQGTLQLAAGGHMAFELPQRFPETAARKGTVEFTAATSSLHVLPLRFAPGGAFTSIRAADR